MNDSKLTQTKVFIAYFEHVFVSWDFISSGKPVTRVCRSIINRVVGLAPQFLSDKCLFYPRLSVFCPISEGKTNTWHFPFITK